MIATKFSKAMPDHFAVSFSRSARDNCDTSCRLWDSCYATRIERIYPELNVKLGRHYRRGAVWVCNHALAELQTGPVKPVDWARLSVDGSMPARSTMSRRRWRVFVQALRRLVKAVQHRNAAWHIPVESYGKARSYRSALRGLGVVVRRTSQAGNVAELIRTSADHVSWVVAKRIQRGHVSKAERAENVAEAYHVANELRAHGKSVVVCPAIAGNSKCGKCTACASRFVDITLFPFHP